MSLWKIAWRSIEQRSLASLLTGISMALGVMLVVAVLVIRGSIDRSFLTNNGLGYNMLVGAKGGRLELVLNSVYYLSRPVENIPYSYYKEFTEGKLKPYVERAIPLCLGDVYGDFRVVGTTPAMFDDLVIAGKKYEFSSGRNFRQEEYFGAVVGSVVARQANLQVGSEFQPSHGAGPDAHVHDAFKVVGVLAPTGTPNDRALFINMEGFFLIPEHAKEPDEEEAASGTAPPAKDKKADHEHEGHADDAHDHDHEAADHKHEGDADGAENHADHDHADHEEAEHKHEGDADGAQEPSEDKPAEGDHDHADHEHAAEGEEADDDHAHEDHAHEHGEEGHAEHEPASDGHDHAGHNHAAHDHEGHDHAGHDHDHDHTPLPESQREVTAILVLTSGFVPEVTSMQLMKKVNKDSVAQAVLPIREITTLFELFVNPLQLILLCLTVLIVIVSGIGILVSIYNSMSDRKHEIAVMRALGAGRQTVLLIVLFESILLSLAGGIFGWLLGHVLVAGLSPWISAQTGVAISFLHFEPYELVIIPGLIVLATLVGFLPAIVAYRTDVAKALTANP